MALVDIYGQVVEVRPGTREAALGRGQLYGICVRTRRGVKGFEATWYPSGHTATFAGKRGATAFVKAHEKAFYALPRIGSEVPANPLGAAEHTHRGPAGRGVTHNHNHGTSDHSHDSMRPFHEWTWVAPDCLWCAGSVDIVTDANAQLCRDHLAEFDGVSVAQLDRADAAAVADTL